MEAQRKPRVVNIGIEVFYQALVLQEVDCAQVQWQPPAEQSEEISALLDDYL